MFNELLNKDNSVSIYIRNIPTPVIELFKFYRGLSPPIIDNISRLKTENSRNLRQVFEFFYVNCQNCLYWEWKHIILGTRDVGYTATKIFKKKKNLGNLEKEIGTWKPNNYPCRLCKVYIKGEWFPQKYWHGK